ncbi:Restriction endonuclease [Anaeromyxobacter dehalogenans 2CP-C]|uniref:Restriction endonuclease n=2 Tax=Anaeromyxobacter dehalogenans TaxID=161493 RepID=Q2IFF1_ANADE|nr:Restriction endonuclease [Anaeromyxobacter dehalogenans 2CP-C]
MPVPSYDAFMLPPLQALAEGDEHNARDLRDQLDRTFDLTDADRHELLPSGKQPVFDGRVGWAKTYLEKAGLLSTSRRGWYRITDAGRSVLAKNPERIDKQYLLQFESFRVFASRATDEPQGTTESPEEKSTPEVTPEEALERAHKEIRAKVETELLDAVGKASPRFFKKLVVELLVQMGYGGSLEDAGRALGRSHDGGIDGIIKEDHLGLDAIYVQAKRWQNNVGRPDVQAFAGSLEGERARKGVFITTSSFSSEARDYVKRIEKKIVLIDGRQLASLMVDFSIGVNTVSTYEIKRVDTDYFAEE